MGYTPQPVEGKSEEWIWENNVGRLMGVGWTFHAIAYIFVILRMYTRLYLVKSFGKDDAMMLLTLASLTAGAMIPQTIAVNFGSGWHQETMTKTDYEMYLKMLFIQAVIASVSSLGFLKLSIAFALLRLSINRWYKRTLYALMAFIVAYVIFGWVTVLAWCSPVKAQWQRDLPGAECYPRSLLNTFALVTTGCNIFTDVCFATLPIPIIWNLQMKQRTRIYLISIFSLGYIVVAVGAAKAYCQASTRTDPDTSFNNWIQFFALLQQNLGIIAACAPSLKPLFNKALKLSSYYGYRSGPSRYGGGYAGQHHNGYPRQSRGYVKSTSVTDEFELSSASRGGRRVIRHPHDPLATINDDVTMTRMDLEARDDRFHTSIKAGSQDEILEGGGIGGGGGGQGGTRFANRPPEKGIGVRTETKIIRDGD